MWPYLPADGFAPFTETALDRGSMNSEPPLVEARGAHKAQSRVPTFGFTLFACDHRQNIRLSIRNTKLKSVPEFDGGLPLVGLPASEVIEIVEPSRLSVSVEDRRQERPVPIRLMRFD